MAVNLLKAGRDALRCGTLEQARAFLLEAFEQAQALSCKYILADASQALGDLYSQLGKQDDELHFKLQALEAFLF